MWFAFFILILSQVYDGVSQTLHDVWYHNRLNAEAGLKAQLFSIKVYTKKFAKMSSN